MAKLSKDWTPTTPAPMVAAPEAQSEETLIRGIPDDVTTRVAEVNQPLAAAQAVSKDVYIEAQDENRKRDFVKQIFDARNENPVKPYTPPPVAEGIAKQTNLEMEVGRKRVAEFEAIEAARPKRPNSENATMVSVFRPNDYIPDARKGQGVVPTVTQRTLG